MALSNKEMVRLTNDEGVCPLCGCLVHIGDHWFIDNDVDGKYCSFMCLEDARNKDFN